MTKLVSSVIKIFGTSLVYLTERFLRGWCASFPMISLTSTAKVRHTSSPEAIRKESSIATELYQNLVPVERDGSFLYPNMLPFTQRRKGISDVNLAVVRCGRQHCLLWECFVIGCSAAYIDSGTRVLPGEWLIAGEEARHRGIVLDYMGGRHINTLALAMTLRSPSRSIAA